MKVILQQDVRGQGKKGQLVEVSDGYARNFLLPKKLAVTATAENVNTMKQQEKAKKAQMAAEKAEAGVPRRRAAAPISLVMETQLLLQMRAYLQGHQDATVTLDELFHAAGGQLKRTRIVKLLADAPWCCQVDRNTYFWRETAPSSVGVSVR